VSTPTLSAAKQSGEPTVRIRTTAVVLGVAWVPLAIGETLLGDLDALADVETVAAGSGRIAVAGLLHIVTGALLAYAAVGLHARLRGRLFGQVAASLTLIVAVCLGAFGMLHLMALEAAASSLDPAAMDEFLGRLSEAPGWWSVPVAVVGLLGMPVLALTCLALARAGWVRWWGPGVVSAGAVAHFSIASGVAEIGAIWAVAVGLAIVAIDLLRAPRSGTPATHS
jgi:hypothetical protein